MSFWRIFHNVVRQDDSQEEIYRATESCVWLAENFISLRKVLTVQQIEVLTYVNTFWFNQRTAPSYKIIKETLEYKSVSPGILELLTEYEEDVENLTVNSPKDMGQLQTDLIETWQSQRLASVLKISRQINNGKWDDPKTKKSYSGAIDATRFLYEQLDTSISFSSGPAVGGALNDTAHEVYAIYEKFKIDRMAGDHGIPTGIWELDNHVPIRRGDFVGVLGYAGQRKSSLCRTFAYNAAKAGFNVLHVSLEQSYDEERTIYGLIHSADPKFRACGFHLSKRNFDDGKLSEAEEHFLKNIVLPDLENNLPGRLLIRQPVNGTSWNNIKTMAELANQTTPIDLFFMDYLTLVSTNTVRDSKGEMEQNIKDAKQMALQFGNGRGVVFLTPIQGNRKGFEEAKATGGAWDMTGVNQYSEFDKSADLILSTFIDDAQWAESSITISSVKIRRVAPLPLFTVPVDSRVGLIGARHTLSFTDDDHGMNTGTLLI